MLRWWLVCRATALNAGLSLMISWSFRAGSTLLEKCPRISEITDTGDLLCHVRNYVLERGEIGKSRRDRSNTLLIICK